MPQSPKSPVLSLKEDQDIVNRGLFFTIFLLVYCAFYPRAAYEAWRDPISGTALIITTTVFHLAFYSCTDSLPGVVMDYVRFFPPRKTVLALIVLGLISMAVWVTLVSFTMGA